MTGENFIVTVENGTTGNTRLFIGQYLAIEDTAGIAPTVKVTAPADGSTVIEGAAVSLKADAVDDIAVAGVNFLVNGQVVFTDTAAPFEYSLTVPTGVGSLTLGATAIDFGSNVGDAADVHVNVIPDPKTTAVGRVVDRNGAPVAGATVSFGGLTATSGGDGTFSLAGVPTVQGNILIQASAVIDGKAQRGRSQPTAPVPSGTTNVGDIRLTGGKVALIHCDATASIRPALTNTGLITSEDLTDINACTAVPSLATLSEYSAVFVWSNFSFQQPEALGNVLADYVDQGGGVVLSTYVFSEPWRIGGRILSAGYSPFGVTNQRFTTAGQLDLAKSDASHPILQGVTSSQRYFTNPNYTNPPLTAGAKLIAVDTNGNRVVAVSPSNRVVGISIWPGPGDMGRLFANAIDFVR